MAMAYMSVIGACGCCGDLFAFNPFHVPSVRVLGEKQPICAECIAAANLDRSSRGIELIEIHPLAYEAENVN
jgi:hypothetical protein